MEIVVLRCPSCGGELDVEPGLESFYCKYCGSHLMVDGISSDMLNAKLKLYEMEHAERTQKLSLEHAERSQQSKQDHAERMQQSKHKHIVGLIILEFVVENFIPLALCTALLLVILSTTVTPFLSHLWKMHTLETIETQVERAIEEEDYDEALFKAEQLKLVDEYDVRYSEDSSKWNEKREQYIRRILALKRKADSKDPNKLSIPRSSEEFQTMTGSEAKSELEDAGFTNVSMSVISGKAGLFKRANLVKEVSFDGLTIYSAQDYCDIDAPIIVYYYER